MRILQVTHPFHFLWSACLYGKVLSLIVHSFSFFFFFDRFPHYSIISMKAISVSFTILIQCLTQQMCPINVCSQTCPGSHFSWLSRCPPRVLICWNNRLIITLWHEGALLRSHFSEELTDPVAGNVVCWQPIVSPFRDCLTTSLPQKTAWPKATPFLVWLTSNHWLSWV